MTFSEYGDELLEDVKTFVLYWKQHNTVNPTHFPLEMEPGE